MARYGVHVSIGGGLAEAVARGAGLGCDTFQMFSRNPRTLKAKPIDPEEAEAFRIAVRESGIFPVVVHVNYLINVASPNDDTYQRSVDALSDELSRADALGAEYVVMHPGHHMGSGPDQAAHRVAQAIDRAYSATGARTRLCLENMSGTGTEVGSSFAELAQIIEYSEYGPSLGICFDTCHGYGAGYDVASAGGLAATMDEMSAVIGVDRLCVVHANDSKGTLGSHKDRHEHIGEGSIGLAGFRLILSRPELHDLPFILETPFESSEDQVRDLAAIRSCYAYAEEGRQ